MSDRPLTYPLAYSRPCRSWLPLVLVIVAFVMIAQAPASPAGAAPVTRTWTGLGTDGKWTNPANWGGTAPQAGDNLIFPAGPARLDTTNDYAPTLHPLFGTIGISGAGYSLSGNLVTLTSGLGTTHTSGNVTVNLKISGATANVGVGGGGRLVLAGANSFDGQVHVERLHHVQVVEELVRDRGNGNVENVHFAALDEVQEQVERAVKGFQCDGIGHGQNFISRPVYRPSVWRCEDGRQAAAICGD